MNQRERSTTTEPGRCGPPDGNGAAKKSKGLPDIIYYLNSGHLTRVVLNSCCVCVCAWLLGSPCVTWSLAATLNLGTNHSDASLASGLIHPASNLIDSRSNVHQFPFGRFDLSTSSTKFQLWNCDQSNHSPRIGGHWMAAAAVAVATPAQTLIQRIELTDGVIQSIQLAEMWLASSSTKFLFGTFDISSCCLSV